MKGIGSMIEVGEFVRINNDFRLIALGIGKVVRINQDSIYVKMNFELPFPFKKENIAKHSKQLVELMEVGDVIKYKELRSITNNFETNFYENYICDVHNEEELESIINECNNKKIKILEILTKEQFLANCYRVGGE